MVDDMASAKLTARPKGADRKRERRLQPARVVAGREECPAEEETLFKALAAGRRAALTVPLARLAIETAARQGEQCSLDWKDVDLEKHNTPSPKVPLAGMNARPSSPNALRMALAVTS
ncbi:hypothetical protein [Nitrospirillum amazonense]|uniref:hypothetical protein n=1 Tax=Nitrospirillum amazonense TaxID=28077 RepID=UPI00241292A4|nr:hypothetical protein [Nitrospirillum amazonense]MDG3439559.1 hypothetical protein [Nitrospirillum amazonense]